MDLDAVNLVEALAGKQLPWGALNVITPNLQVHVYCGAQGRENQPESGTTEDGEIFNVKLELRKLSQAALSEVAMQLCLICAHRYSSSNQSRAFPCGHFFCIPCVTRQLEEWRAEQQQK